MSSDDILASLSPGERAELRLAAYRHGGTVPVPFVGTTWYRHDGRYWARRCLAWLTLLLCAALCAALTAGFALGIAGSPAHGAKLAGAAAYCCTVVPGAVLGIRAARRGPWRQGRAVQAGGCAAVLLAPLAAGFCLGYLALTLGREFPGESHARAFTEHLRWLERQTG